MAAYDAAFSESILRNFAINKHIPANNFDVPTPQRCAVGRTISPPGVPSSTSSCFLPSRILICPLTWLAWIWLSSPPRL